MQLNFINSITIISLFQAIFLAITFFFKKADGKPIYNKLFAGIVFIFALQILVSLSVNYWSYIYVSVFNKPFYIIYQTAFLIGPLIYFYIKSITDINYRFRKIELLHFLPFLIITIFIAILLYGFNITLKWNYTRIGIIIHSVIYCIISLRHLRYKGLKIKSIFNLTNPPDFIQFLLICYIILWLVNVQIFAIIKYIAFAKWCAYVSSLYALSLFIFINSIAFLALTKPNLFVLKGKYPNSLLGEDEKDKIYSELMNYFKTQKPYLEPCITLANLSESMNMPAKYISQIINEKHHQNFSDFVNTFRIEESKKYLQNQSFNNMTIQEVFYKVGFNSKSSFNLVFKKHTRLTPVEYRKKFLS